MPPDRPPEPWRSFLADIDRRIDHPVVLHCLGGFAMAMLYALPRPTIDVDYLAVVPAQDVSWLQALAGRDSALHGKHGVYLQHAGIVTAPADYADRLIPIASAAPLDLSVLERRYRSELRPYLANAGRHDLTLRLWLEMLSGD